MKKIISMWLVCCLCAVAQTERKYGILASDDAGLLKAVRRVGAVILGKIDQDVKAGDGWDLHATVVECYKGKLKPGDSVFIAIAAESGPDPKEEIGKQRFFFLTPNDHVVAGVTASFWCEWTDNLRYEKFGEPVSQFLRTVPQMEIACLDDLLVASAERELGNLEKEEMLPAVLPHSGMGWSHAILSMRWVARSELLARKHYWEDCLASHRVPHGTVAGERYEGFSFTDFSVCEYQKSVTHDDHGRTLAEPYDHVVWQRWIPPEKGSQLYQSFADLPNSAQAKPDETSWCVMMDYVQDGKFHERHFYMPSRLEMQTLLHRAAETGVDCSEWNQYDKRLWTVPDWLARDLKYDQRMWYRHGKE